MTLSFFLRMLYVWLWMLAHGANPASCDRVWDMSPDRPLPSTSTYEEWYGSPTLVCSVWSDKEAHHVFGYCIGPNC